jgi:Amt family ammonium transporter
MVQHSLLDILWIITASALVFVMRAGFAMLEAGMVRSKNSINISVKVLTDLGVSLTAFWPLGFGLMFGLSQSGLFGTSLFFPKFDDQWLAVFFLFHAMFASTSATIVSGAVGERIKYSAYMMVTLISLAVIYPVVGHWVWGGSFEGQASGWLAKMGFIDFAGCTVVHSTGGWISLAVLLILGARIGRYNTDGSVNRITGSGLHISVFGTIILWFGWFGFNGGSTLAMNADVPAIILKTSLSGAAGMIVTLLVGWRIRKFPDVALVINGALAGLVGATASCAYISEWSAVIIGGVAGMVMLFAEWLLDKLQIDDAVTAIPVHLGCGIWGTLAVGIFGDPALLKTGLSRLDQIWVQCIGIGAGALWAFGFAFVCIWILNRFFPIRVKPEEEAQGLNVMEHQASTEIFDLYRTLEEQAKTGDLSLRAPVEPFTEVGQIATQYNKVIDNLQTNLVARSEYTNILSNVSDGLFLLDERGQIGPYYSASLESILETKSIAGRELYSVLSPLMTTLVMETLREYVNVLFNGSIDERTLSRLNPLAQVEIFVQQGAEMKSKHVQFLFKRILEGSKVVRLMVLLRDVSQQVELEKTMVAEKQERDSEMDLFYRIIHIDPSLLKEFLESLEDKLDSINQLLEGGQANPGETLNQIFRIAHSLKGESSVLDLKFITDAAHSFEDIVKNLQTKDPLDNSEFISLTFKLGELQETARQITTLLDKISSLQKHIKTPEGTLVSSSKDFSQRLAMLVSQMAGETGKKISFDSAGYVETLIPTSMNRTIQDMVIQLVRNAAVHGIETPEFRKKLEKSETGKIELRTYLENDALIISVADDGKGLEPEVLKYAAIKAGKATEAQTASWTATDLIRFIFAQGVSLAPNVTAHAGRGVGLALVRELSKSLNGKIAVKWKTGMFMNFIVTIPLPKNQL